MSLYNGDDDKPWNSRTKLKSEASKTAAAKWQRNQEKNMKVKTKQLALASFIGALFALPALAGDGPAASPTEAEEIAVLKRKFKRWSKK